MGFAGRLLPPAPGAPPPEPAGGGRGAYEAPKYTNSPESRIFKKRELLYGMHLAKGAARKAGEVVVVEGYLDVIALRAAGVLNAVAHPNPNPINAVPILTLTLSTRCPS